MQNFNTLIHFHIGKTGGLTLKNILEKKYKKKFLRLTINKIHHDKKIYEYMGDFLKYNDSQMTDIECISGHIPFGIHNFLNNKSKYLTVLRNPIQRIISDYYFTLRVPELPFNKFFLKDKKISLEDFIKIDTYEIRKENKDGIYFGSGVQNLYYRLFSGNLFGEVFSNKYSNNYSVNELINNINKNFFLVGTLETFDYFLVLLKRKLKWNFFDIIYKKINISNYNYTPDSKIISLIEKYNEKDIEIYNYYNLRVKEQINNQNIESDYKKFVFINKYFQILNLINQTKNYFIKKI